MLDLNLDVVSSESSCDGNMNINDKVRVLTAMEDSGSMKSSIINDEDVPSNACRSENSSNRASPASTAFVFDILKKETNDTTVAKKVENPSPDFVTRQLFPVTREKSDVELEFGIKPLVSRPQWLNFTYDVEYSTGEAELMTNVPIKPRPKKCQRGPRSRSSQYRGVTFYRRTGRWESHIWDCGKQVYLGGFDTAHAAARAYDRAAIKFRGVEADINFTLGDYEEDMIQMKHMNKEEFVHALRRQGNGSSRGNSKYRGVTLHNCGRWEAGMGQFLGKKAYDMAAIRSNESESVTNFEPSTYEGGGKCDHNLDLSLGISATPVARNRINDARDFHFRNAAVGVEPQHGLKIVPKHHNEERTMPRRANAVSSTGYSNWAWQMQGDGKIISSTPMFSVAASSGFSSSTAIASSSTLPFDNSGRNPTPATFTNNISHYRNYKS